MDNPMRFRVLLEPRGFIKGIEFILAIVAFATTGGYHSSAKESKKCTDTQKTQEITIPVKYPFNLESTTLQVYNCDINDTVAVQLDGDFSPTSQWFVFVGVMAFLITIASAVFYVAFESKFREKNEHMVTVADLCITVIWTFLWLTAAASWAWGVGQVKYYAGRDQFVKVANCSEANVTCTQLSSADYGPLTASVAFAFLSVFVWAGNVWFVYKETPYHEDQADLTPNEGGPTQQVPGNQT